MLNFGLIGPGRAGARFAQGLAGVPDASLAGIWGRNPDRAHAFAARFQNEPGCPVQAPLGRDLVLPTLPELLSSDIDAVYIATHPDTHADFCLQALAAGKHVLCEKPATLNVRQLEQVLAAARTHGLLFMEAMKPPFFPLYQRLREHLDRDPIGPVGFVRAGHCDSTLAPDYPLRFLSLGGGGILGIGPYEAFLACEWLGPFQRAQTMGRINAEGVDNFALFQTEHERGMAQLHTGLDLLSRGDAILCAPGGYVLLHANWWNPHRATIHYRDGRQVHLDEPFHHGGFNYETAHFCDLLRQGLRESPVISHALSLDMARLLESARTALGVRFPGE